MSAPEPDPAKRPFLFPDPVIEFYMKRVDRAAIRERLKMTTEGRLEALQREVDARTAKPPARVREEARSNPAPPLKFYGEEFQPLPSAARLLFPDPVIDAYIKDVDRTLVRAQLAKDPTGRLQSLIAMAEFWNEARKARLRKKNGLSRA